MPPRYPVPADQVPGCANQRLPSHDEPGPRRRGSIHQGRRLPDPVADVARSLEIGLAGPHGHAGLHVRAGSAQSSAAEATRGWQNSSHEHFISALRGPGNTQEGGGHRLTSRIQHQGHELLPTGGVHDSRVLPPHAQQLVRNRPALGERAESVRSATSEIQLLGRWTLIFRILY